MDDQTTQPSTPNRDSVYQDSYKISGGMFVLALLGGMGVFIPVLFEGMFLLLPLSAIVIVLIAMSIAHHQGRSSSRAAWVTLSVIGVIVVVVYSIALVSFVYLVATCKF